MEDPLYRKFMNKALRALARRAHTRSELKEKFEKDPRSTPELTEKVLARLEELGLVNDENFIRNTIEASTRYKPQGPFKLAARLRQKGIPVKATQEAWNAMELSERDLAAEALTQAQKRFAKVPPEKLYQKRAQFLASRGFSPEIIFELAKSRENQ